MKIQESTKNYLETIFMLVRGKPYACSIDIANELGFSKPSASAAMKNLRQNGYIQTDDQGHITLTPFGQAIADTMYERHIPLFNWLICLGMDPRTVAEDVCCMEHTLSTESFDAIKRHITHGHELPDQEEAYAQRPCETMPFLQKTLSGYRHPIQ